MDRPDILLIISILRLPEREGLQWVGEFNATALVPVAMLTACQRGQRIPSGRWSPLQHADKPRLVKGENRRVEHQGRCPNYSAGSAR